ITAIIPKTRLLVMMTFPSRPAPACRTLRSSIGFASFRATFSSRGAAYGRDLRQNGYLLSGAERLNRIVVIQRVDEIAGHDAEVCTARQPTRRELTLQILFSIVLAGDRVGKVLRGARALAILVRLHGLDDVLHAEREAWCCRRRTAVRQSHDLCRRVHTLEPLPFCSLKIATVRVASVPRLMVLGKGKLGLIPFRCVQGNGVVGTPLTIVIVPPQSLPSPMPLPSTSFLRKKSVSSSLVISLPNRFDVRVSLRPPPKSMAAESR